MKLPTGSRISLAMSCSFPFTSGMAWPYDPTGSPAMEYGNACHDVGEAVAKLEAFDLVAISKKRGLSEADEKRLENASKQIVQRVQTLIDDGWMLFPEVAFAVHVENETSRVMKRKHHRDYSDRRPGELTATLDLVLVKDGVVAYSDWKSGRKVESVGKTSWQMKFGALALARYVGADSVLATLSYVGEDGISDDPVQLDSFDLDLIAEEMRGMWKRLHAGPSAPVLGSHCSRDWCPLLSRCPATQSALATVQPMERALSVNIESPEHARWIRERLGGAEAALKAVKDAVNEYARHTPIPMGDGKVYAWKDKSERDVKITTREQLVALESVLGEHARAAVEPRYHVTLASIKDAARDALAAQGKTRGLKQLERQCHEALAKVGAFKVNTWSSPQEFKPNDNDVEQLIEYDEKRSA